MSWRAVRSLLFLPATSVQFVARAGQRGADALILDLEDAVLASRKAEARTLAVEAARALKAAPACPRLLVRVNTQAELLPGDLDCAVRAGAHAVVVPKVGSAELLQEIGATLTRLEALHQCSTPLGVAAVLETPLGILRAAEIAHSGGRLCALGFGAGDLGLALDAPADSPLVAHAACTVSMAAAAAGLAAWGPVEPVVQVADTAAFQRLVLRTRSMGFSACVAVHPLQVEAIRRAYQPDAAQREAAQRVLAAADQAAASGAGAYLLDGMMVDTPGGARPCTVEQGSRNGLKSRTARGMSIRIARRTGGTHAQRTTAGRVPRES